MPSDRAYDLLGFDSPGAYTQRVLKTPQNLVKRVFLIHPADEQMEWRAEGKHDMKRVLVGLLLWLGPSQAVQCTLRIMGFQQRHRGVACTPWGGSLLLMRLLLTRNPVYHLSRSPCWTWSVWASA